MLPMPCMGLMGSVGSAPDLASQVAALFAPGGFKGAMVSSVMSTLDQDNLGATPVTALNQTAGRRKDQSGLANHFVQATSTARPLYSARKNALLMSETLSDAAWTKANSTVIGGKLGELAATGNHGVAQSFRSAGGVWIHGAYLKPDERTFGALRLYDGQSGVGAGAVFNLATGVVTSADAGITPAIVDAGILGKLCTITRTLGTHPGNLAQVFASDGTLSYAGVAGSGILVGGVQALPGSDWGRYQRVGSAFDYDDVGFPRLILFDVVDDSLVATFGAALGTNCTVVRSVSGVGSVILTGQNVGTTYTDTASNHALAIFDGPLNAAQTTLVMAWANQQAAA